MGTRKITQIAGIVTTLSLLAAIVLHLTCNWSSSVAPYKFPKTSEPDIEKALDSLKKRVQLFPDSVIETNGLAGLYIQLSHETGDHKLILEAEKLAKKSWKLRQFENSAAQLLLAEVAESRHAFHDSLKIAHRVLASEPRNLGAYNVLVTSNLGLGRNDEALSAVKVLIEKKPSLGNYILLGLVQESLGNIHESRASYEKGLSLEDLGEAASSAWVRTLLGRSYFEQGDLKTSRAYFNSALKILPSYHLALSLLAKLEVQVGNYEVAERFYTEAYQHSGEPPYLIEHAKLKKIIGDMKSANEKLDQAEKIVREELVTTPFGHPAELIEVLLEKGGMKNIEEAVQLATREVKSREKYAKAHRLLSKALALRNSQ